MTASAAAKVQVRIPSRLGYEKVAMSAAASVARLAGLAEERIEDLKTALAEACINAMEHGNRMNESSSVLVMLRVDPDSIEVKIGDSGAGLQGTPPRPDIDRKMHGEEGPRGMGMYLIQALVDEAEWVSGANGSYVRLVIRMNRVGSREE